MATDVVVLAAGKGTRMKSSLPKVLHCLAGRPLLQHVVDAANSLQTPRVIIVTGHESDKVRSEITLWRCSVNSAGHDTGDGRSGS
mgnify:CR=1 FL=1